MEQLYLDNQVIEYELYRSARAKTLRIIIRDQKVRVAAPVRISTAAARKFVESHKEWIRIHLHKQATKAKAAPSKQYLSGEPFLYLGQPYPLLVEAAPNPPYTAFLGGDRIFAVVPPFLSPAEQAHRVRTQLLQWYLHQAKAILPAYLQYFAEELQIPYQLVRIKDQKTRWGSCSAKGSINLNWRLIMAPKEVLAYVIAHELIHLQHMNHSQDFWRAVEKTMPDYKKWRSWLSEHGRELVV